ncbi:MAG: hypothetical protein R8G01_19135 [Ilumatobacteraceae bacterium]|nr:hypothetical protein [Ilumatobacteraceae bacterium]
MSDGPRPDSGEPDDEPLGDSDASRRIEPPSLKDLLGDADDTDVLDGPTGRPRLTWDAVTDSGGAPVETDHRPSPQPSRGDSSFQFDLGGALARLAGDAPAETPAADEHPTPTEPVPPPSHEAVPPVAEPAAAPDPEPFVAPPSATPPPPSRLTRPIEPMTYESVVREPSTPPVPAPPAATPPPVAPPPAEAPQPDYPRRVPGTHLESQMRPAQDAVPEIREATPADAAPRPFSRSSVFDDLESGNATGAPNLPSSSTAAAPSVPTAAPSVPSPAFMPSLPASNPAAPPPIAEPVSSAPSTPDINALRSAQLRASKQQRQGKMFARSLLAFVVIGGLIAGALVFGRSLLFDTEWDAQLTPIVNEIEAERGSFDRPVPLVAVPAAELGERLQAAAIGDAWVERVPEWRALGVATGSVDATSVGAALTVSTTAVYDPTGDQIYQLEGVDPAVGAGDLRVALNQAFDAQFADANPDANPDVSDASVGDDIELGNGLTGVSSLESIATRAVDEVLATGGAVGAREPADDALPLPIAYELAAVKVLGEPILSAIGLDPATYTVGDPYPASIATVLDDAPATAAGALIQPGEVSLAAPRALGNDDWSLAWGARLPGATVDLLVDQVVADSYRPVSRAGVTCFVAVFDTVDEAAGNSVFASLLTWAANAPAASQALATSVGPTRVQLDACDPGAEAASPANAGTVDALIDRQQRRLTN